MRAGCSAGRRGRVGLGVDLFVGEDGYTSVAVAVALLASVALVLSVASAQWTLSRSADVQEVADATALAGSNVVSSYVTIAQVADACVLSLGLVGMAVLGAGLVLAAIPGAEGASGEVLRTGSDILDARNRFARSAAHGLQTLEAALPGLVVANSWACAHANAQGGAQLAGAALPFPLDSQSDFSSLGNEVTDDGVMDAAEDLQDATRRAKEAKDRADDALRRAWEADCVDNPRCMRSRAQSLAGLSGSLNPMVAQPQDWTFGVAIERSRAYYQSRLEQERPEAYDIESLADSVAREAFYDYALEEVCGAWYWENADGTVSLNVPHLARNKQEVRMTRLYTDAVWPCTFEEAGRTLHAIADCPGATGSPAGTDSVAAIEAGEVCLCDVCRFDVGDLGSVASISTIATNGYEHYWQIVVEEAQAYKTAKDEQAEAERQAKGVAERGKSVFDKAIEQLGVPRPRICPPGAWGCVSVVVRGGGTAVPSELTDAFLSHAELPAGAAVSASALAPDAATSGNSVLAHVFDGVAKGGGSVTGSLLGSVVGLWGELLVSYGSAYEGVGNAVGGYLDKADGVFGGTIGAWLKDKVTQSMAALGLAPADMRMRKPVLVSTTEVLGQSGMSGSQKVRELIRSLPAGGSAGDFCRSLGVWVWDGLRRRTLTIADLPVPGTGTSIPLTVDLSGLGGGVL